MDKKRLFDLQFKYNYPSYHRKDGTEWWKNRNYWSDICYNQPLSEEFIREFADYVDWGFLAQRQRLSENLMRDFQDRISFNTICYHQRLSEEFIREFADRLNWFVIIQNQKVSDEFKSEMAKYVWNFLKDYKPYG